MDYLRYENRSLNKYRKIFKKYLKSYIMKHKFFKQVKKKHSVYKKSVCIGGEWKKKERKKERGECEEKGN